MDTTFFARWCVTQAIAQSNQSGELIKNFDLAEDDDDDDLLINLFFIFQLSAKFVDSKLRAGNKVN